MRVGPLGRRYARALLELAEEQGQLERVQKDLDTLAAAWGSSGEMRNVFENPAFGTDARKGVLEKLATRMGLSPVVKNTVLLLSDHRRIRYLPEVAEAFTELAEERAGRIRAEVVTASAMPEAYYGELLAPSRPSPAARWCWSASRIPLIAGVVTRIGDKVFDGSLKNRLDELREELLRRADPVRLPFPSLSQVDRTALRLNHR